VKDCATYTILSGPAQAAEGRLSEVKPPQKPEPDQAVEDQKDRYNEVEQSRHDQDQKARDHGYDR
jgi:hypothetical protein